MVLSERGAAVVVKLRRGEAAGAELDI